MRLELPEDLGQFWADVWEEAHTVPLDYRRSPSERQFDVPHRVERIDFQSVGGHRVSGWLACPEGARRERAFVWVPPYGRESLLPNAYGTREGFVSLSLNLHGEDAFHQEKYRIERGYFAEGAEDPKRWIFRRLAQHAMVALRVLRAQSEADEDRLGVMGMSQGAGITLWLAAACPLVRAACADMPFLSQIDQSLKRSAYRYPLKELADFIATEPLGEARVGHTLSYFDTSLVATRIGVPTLVSLGEKDPSCRPDSVQAAYEAVSTSQKRLIRYAGGHDWDPDMVTHNADWLTEHLG